MIPRQRHLRRAHLPALLVFGIVYLAALVLIVSPSNLRAVAPGGADTSGLLPLSKGDK